MKSITTKYIFFPVLVLLCLAGLASCDYIHDELPLCRHTLRFVYRHNIKHADAFAYEMENQEVTKNVDVYKRQTLWYKSVIYPAFPRRRLNSAQTTAVAIATFSDSDVSLSCG